MKQISIVFLFVCCLISGLFSQNPNDNNPKHTNYYKVPDPIKTNDYTITIDDIVAKMEYVKMKVKIVNNTSDYLIFKPSECSLQYENGEFKPTKDFIVIKPYDWGSRVIEVKGGNNFHKDSFVFKLNGLYRVSAKGNVQQAPDFKLPVTVNDFDAGTFKCNMLGLKKETQETWVKFNCIYNGSQMGIIEPSKAVIKLEKNGLEFATSDSKLKPVLLFKGESDKFSITFNVQGKIADMQFANMSVVWKNTFIESEPKQITIAPITISVDPGLTAGKNK